MVNKIIIGLLVVALAANGVLGYFAYMQKGDINALVEVLTATRQEAAASATAQAEQLDTARQEITSLIGENTTLIADLEEDITANVASINTESGRINALGGNLSALSSKVDNIVPGLAADEVYQQVSQTVVEISDGEDTVGVGSMYYDNRHVVTAYHVIEDIDNIYVILADGTISKASIVGSSIRSDVSVLKLEHPTALAPATMADSDNLSIGDHVFVIGHPFDEDNSLTVGVVSHLNRFCEFGYGQDAYWLSNLIQFDAPTNFGNPGGPVFNADGDVIGMVTGIINPLIGEGMAYGTSSNKLKRVADSIIVNGEFRYPYLAVYVTDVTPTEAEAAGRETVHGVQVKTLSHAGPATSAGIQVGDIIVAMDNIHINDIAHLASYIGEHTKPGDLVVVCIIRDGTELEITITIGAHTDQPWRSGAPDAYTTPMPSM